MTAKKKKKKERENRGACSACCPAGTPHKRRHRPAAISCGHSSTSRMGCCFSRAAGLRVSGGRRQASADSPLCAQVLQWPPSWACPVPLPCRAGRPSRPLSSPPALSHGLPAIQVRAEEWETGPHWLPCPWWAENSDLGQMG
ncbi:hypothetical protein DV515_00006665, partial [Chloebia gouldiae]